MTHPTATITCRSRVSIACAHGERGDVAAPLSERGDGITTICASCYRSLGCPLPGTITFTTGQPASPECSGRSAAARRSIAGATWGAIQHTTKLGRDVASYESATHGGLVAAVPNLPRDDDDWLDLARELRGAGILHTVRKVPVSRSRSRYLATSRYAISGPIADSWELLVGEEDVNWAVVVLVLDILGVPFDHNAGYSTRRSRADYIKRAETVAATWHPAVFAALGALRK